MDTKKKPEVTQPGLKLFINECNSFLSQAIIEELRNDHLAFGSSTIQSHKIYGTPSSIEKDAPIPNGVTKVLARDRKQQIYKTIL